MNHIAIMDRKHGLIEAIVEGRKIIETRWYRYRICPWSSIGIGDVIWFKYSGKSVIARATVSKVLQFEDLDETKFYEIVREYGDEIMLSERSYSEYYLRKNYVILIFLENAQVIEKPFNIDKSGYGTGCAWICVEDINRIRK